MESKKITLAGKEFDVPEMPIGKRKFLVPAIRKFYSDLNAKPAENRFDLDEPQFDSLIEMVFRAVFPQIPKKDDLLSMIIKDDELFAALFIVVEQCGLKRVEQTPGEAHGETTQNSPTTTA